MRRIFFFPVFLTFLGLSIQLSAQEEDDWRLYRPKTVETRDSLTRNYTPLHYQPKTGKIDIIADSRIKELNIRKKESPTKMDGYRVQIYFGNRNAAQEKRGEFIRNYSDKSAYISYLAPNFRLRVGDFRTRLESEKFKQEIAKSFPGCYIVKDKIELPPLGGSSQELEVKSED